MLNWVQMNQSSWISILLTHSYSKFHWVLISNEKTNYCWSLIHTLAITILKSELLNYFLTPLMLCAIVLYISGGTYSLKPTTKDRCFEKRFMAILFTPRVFARNRQRNTFYILYWCLAWGPNPSFTSYKPTCYLLDYGDS